MTTARGASDGPAFDIQLNANAPRCNVPAAVWHYRLGGYRLRTWCGESE